MWKPIASYLAPGPFSRTMPVHRASKTFFYHIPKCAGSSIEEQFGMRTIENLFLPEFDTVRHDGVRF